MTGDRGGGTVTFDDVAHELYGVALSEFTATRDVAVRQAKDAGDRELAARIKALRRPTVAAWLANQLVREHAEEVDRLLALGEALRAATAQLDGRELRALSGQQRQLVAALVTQARTIAQAAGQPVSDDAARGLEDTLQAALADLEAADALAAGQLTAALTPAGFGGLTLASAPEVSVTAATPLDARDVDQAPAEFEAALSADAAARDALADALATTEQAADAAQRAAARVAELRAQLEEAIRAQAEADAYERAAQAARERAERTAQDAAQSLATARLRLDGSG